MASRRGNPVARVGRYAQQEVDTVGMDPEMKEVLMSERPTAMTKVESDYVKGAGGRSSAMEAVRRARKANRKPPAKEY